MKCIRTIWYAVVPVILVFVFSGCEAVFEQDTLVWSESSALAASPGAIWGRYHKVSGKYWVVLEKQYSMEPPVTEYALLCLTETLIDGDPTYELQQGLIVHAVYDMDRRAEVLHKMATLDARYFQSQCGCPTQDVLVGYDGPVLSASTGEARGRLAFRARVRSDSQQTLDSIESLFVMLVDQEPTDAMTCLVSSLEKAAM
ncbi:MAG: hypothetical protein JW828_05165 [Sedimentisphaerales bacterium]|nr:hypothetical protein [Sedimentisphaerales bacterium]